ncbi:hypothetical protein K0M31_013420 [Melipona bicolor]|uniref:Uncharacterized protein n=1 Tax=Melipona bicolor TaxID=60889 RepID=A0AA40FHK9_9HYME|nr:hypothetical protein K0M31_013420 [Melipona bicolor]
MNAKNREEADHRPSINCDSEQKRRPTCQSGLKYSLLDSDGPCSLFGVGLGRAILPCDSPYGRRRRGTRPAWPIIFYSLQPTVFYALHSTGSWARNAKGEREGGEEGAELALDEIARKLAGTSLLRSLLRFFPDNFIILI